MQSEDFITKKIDILNNVSEEQKQELFSQMEINDLMKLIYLVEEGEKNV